MTNEYSKIYTPFLDNKMNFIWNSARNFYWCNTKPFARRGGLPPGSGWIQTATEMIFKSTSNFFTVKILVKWTTASNEKLGNKFILLFFIETVGVRTQLEIDKGLFCSLNVYILKKFAGAKSSVENFHHALHSTTYGLYTSDLLPTSMINIKESTEQHQILHSQLKSGHKTTCMHATANYHQQSMAIICVFVRSYHCICC